MKNTSKKFKNKEAIEFKVVRKDIEHPSYTDPNAPEQILIHMPKDVANTKIREKHDKLLKEIDTSKKSELTEEIEIMDLFKYGKNEVDLKEITKVNISLT